jgi:hypothetical protein
MSEYEVQTELDTTLTMIVDGIGMQDAAVVAVMDALDVEADAEVRSVSVRVRSACGSHGGNDGGWEYFNVSIAYSPSFLAGKGSDDDRVPWSSMI